MSSNLLQSLKDQNSEDRQPALRIGISTGTVAGILSLILYFFPSLPEELVKIVLIVMVIVVPIISAIFTRRKVWSPSSMNQIVDIVTALAKADRGKTQALTKTDWNAIENRSQFRSGRASLPPTTMPNPRFPEE